LALVVTAVAALGLNGKILAGSQARAADAYFPSRSISPEVAVVGIDPRAIAEARMPWPWPRVLQAALIRGIASSGSRLIVVDVVYSPETDHDDELSMALRSAGNVVVAGAAELTRSPGRRLLVARSFTGPVATVADAAADVGQANILPDTADGIVRSLPVATETADGDLIPSLTLAAVTHLDRAPGTVTLRPHGIQVGSRYIPTGELGLLEVNYTSSLSDGTDSSHYFSAADVLAERVGDRLSGKVVVVGLADPTLGDQHLTRDNKQAGIAGVFIHANAINTVLTGTYLSPVSRVEALVTVFLLAFVAAILVLAASLWVAVPATTLAGVGYGLFAFTRFGHGQIMDLVYPALALVITFVAALALRYLAEARQRRTVTELLSHYVPTSVARDLVDRSRRSGLPTGTITFLFTDVAGSTRAWEEWPQAMSGAMRRHDSLIEQAISEAGGALVRPRGEGDSRFGVFVRPSDGIRAAAEIQRLLTAERWDTPEPVRIRMALHTGEGELREGDYYGSPVNRCARLRSLADPGQILLSEVMAEAVSEDLPANTELRDLGIRELKDMAVPEHVYELAMTQSTLPTA
jgi:class 3 adenylate cyclase/CHASE2 domain-containing sensor protein